MANLDSVYDIDHRTTAFENHDRGLLVCLAGPGTGKTHSLLKRAAALQARECAPDSICYLSFIKEISNAFIADYIAEFGQAAYEASAPRISTLHSFACRLLRNQGFRLGYDGDLFFTSTAEADDCGETLLSDLLPIARSATCRTVPQLRSVIHGIKEAWRNQDDPTLLKDPTPRILSVAIALLRCFRVADWDQTIPLAATLLAGMEEAPSWITKIKHYFVDEYQDFNRAEQSMIRLLGAAAETIVIVGDDDQSLYSSRGGAPEGIQLLFDDHTNDCVSLVKCYRCKANLVSPANMFQAALSARPRPLTAAYPAGEVLCYRFKSSKAEVAFLAGYLTTKLGELPEDPKPKDGIVCLFPSKRVLNCYLDMLSPTVPCSSRQTASSETRLWLERVLQLVQRPGQRFLERLLLRSYPDVKPKHRHIIVARILERDVSPSASAQSLLSEGAIAGTAATALRAFCDACAAYGSRDAARIAPLIAARLGVPEAEVLSQLEVLLATRDDIFPEDPVTSVADALLPETASVPEDPRSVLFLTMHGSKGLTRRTVVIPGLEEACLPGTTDALDAPERARLFFVAMTRATDHLLLTFPLNRGGDSLNFPMPGRGVQSSFIAQAGLVATYHA